MTGKRFFALLAFAAVAAVLVYAGRERYRDSGAVCYACRRSVHANTRTIAIDNGHRRTFCCPACALSEHEQEGQPVRITELTGFLTGEKLSPGDAFIVKGSNWNVCAHNETLLDENKHSADLRFDRCVPSMLAFRKQADAIAFAREHGGEVMPFTRMASAYAR